MQTTQGVPTTIDDLALRVHGRFWDTAVPPATKLWADREMERIQGDLDLIRRDDGFEHFLAEYVAREHERLHYDGDPERAPYDSLREDPLCTCRDYGCPLKDGRVPRRIREADDLHAAMREWTLDHTGDPLVLDADSDALPAGARQAWSDKRARVFSVLRVIEMFTAPERDEITPPSPTEVAGNPHVDGWTDDSDQGEELANASTETTTA
jgi:hypothetical protein